MDLVPERPLECGECKKPVAVIYTEVVGKMMYRMAMCSDCPMLRQKLYGSITIDATSLEAINRGLSCGNCGTTADEVRMGSNVGCSLCYEVFQDIITQEISSQEKLPLPPRGKRQPLEHLGRNPGQSASINPALKLLSLQQALNDTLSREDYEQAAWLRDQIKEITEGKKDEPKST